MKSSYGTNNPTYILPHYVTGLLLARNVEVEFSIADASVSARAVRQSTSIGVSGRVAFWSASFSTSFGHSERTMSVESSATGLRVSIPGAQVIGYYTQVVPLFPK